ncbi:MAG: sulfatase [bacterium]
MREFPERPVGARATFRARRLAAHTGALSAFRSSGRPPAAPALLWAAVLAAFVTGCSSRSDVRSVVLVTIDTWRADRFGAGGNPVVRTPHLDRFFRGATQFADAWSAAPTTLASHSTMLTGLWPTEHGVPRNGWPLPPEVPTLAEELRKDGIATGAFVSSAALDPAFGLARGFDVYDASPTRAETRDQAWRPAPETIAKAEAWWPAAGRRRFLWVHFFEPHFPYEPDSADFALYDTGYRGPANGSMQYLRALWSDSAPLPEDARAHLESLYVAEITGLDRKIGAFLEALAAEEGVLTVVTADHGESLGEHGIRFLHGPGVYAGDVQVPLAVRGSRTFPPGITRATVRTIDIPRTILAALGVRSKLAAEGEDLASRVRGGEGEVAFSEASMPWNLEVEGRYPNLFKQRAVRTDRWTLVETPYLDRREWFVRAEDPGELGAPAAVAPEAQAVGLSKLLADWIARGRPRRQPSDVDPALAEKLRSLGYVDGTSPSH